MAIATRNKRAKSDPELLKLADRPACQLPEARGPDRRKRAAQAAHPDAGEARPGGRNDRPPGPWQERQGDRGTANTRNGYSTKTLKGEFGALPLEVPRAREGTFEPQIVVKHRTRWTGFDDKIISTRGLSREIQSHLEEMYGTEVSPTLISNVTDAVSEDAKL